MSEQAYAVISGNKVVNVVMWDGERAFNPGEGLILVALNGSGGIDWDYVDGQFVDNRPKPNLETE